VDLASTEGLGDKLPLRRRLLATLKTGPQAVGILSSVLDSSERAIRQALSRGEGTDFIRVMGSDPVEWALLSHNESVAA
jgi:hypothetical protein